jgi:hypothetical protein
VALATKYLEGLRKKQLLKNEDSFKLASFAIKSGGEGGGIGNRGGPEKVEYTPRLTGHLTN